MRLFTNVYFVPPPSYRGVWLIRLRGAGAKPPKPNLGWEGGKKEFLNDPIKEKR